MRETPESGVAMADIANIDLARIFAPLNPPCHFSAADGGDSDAHAAAILEMLVEEAAPMGAQGLRFTFHEGKLTVEALLCENRSAGCSQPTARLARPC